MYNFILQIALMVSLGTIIYLIARAIPRVGDEISEPTRNAFDRWISSLPLQRIDASFGNFLEKLLRKFRLILMRLDNAVGDYLNKVKKFNGNGQKNGEEKPSLFNGNGRLKETTEDRVVESNLQSDDKSNGSNNGSHEG